MAKEKNKSIKSKIIGLSENICKNLDFISY